MLLCPPTAEEVILHRHLGTIDHRTSVHWFGSMRYLRFQPGLVQFFHRPEVAGNTPTANGKMFPSGEANADVPKPPVSAHSIWATFSSPTLIPA